MEWQRRQICEFEAVLIDTELLLRLIEKQGIELRRASYDSDSSGLRMQAEGKLECWGKLPLQENAADMRGQRALAELSPVEPAKHGAMVAARQKTIPTLEANAASRGSRCREMLHAEPRAIARVV